MQCGVWNQMKIWSSHLLDNLSNCLVNLKNSGDSTGFEPMTSATPVQCSNQLSNEVTQWRAGQFVGLMFSRERNVHECSRMFTFLSRENMSTTNWPALHCVTSLLSWLEHCTGIAEVMGSNPVESPEFFRFTRQLLKLSSKCEDHIFIW